MKGTLRASRMWTALCAASLLLAFCVAAPAQASKTRTKDGRAVVNSGRKGAHARAARRLVEAVEVEGNRRLTDEEILAHVRARPGQVYDEQQVIRDLRVLLDTGVFDKTRTRVQTTAGVRGGVVVIFSVAEMPVIAALKFEGLPEGLAEADVLKALRADGIKLEKGDVYDPSGVSRAVAVVKRLLAARGLRGMSVEGFIEEVSMTHVRLRISVTDGRDF